jgi:hypothetical protein
MTELAEKIICLLDSSTDQVAQVSVSSAGAEILGATGQLQRILPPKLRVLTTGVFARMERFTSDEISVGLEPVKPGDYLYVQGLVDALRFHGFLARAHDRQRADAWWLLRTLPIGRLEATTICLSLDAMSAGDLEGLLEALHQAESELADLTKRESEAREISAERRREILKSIQ